MNKGLSVGHGAIDAKALWASAAQDDDFLFGLLTDRVCLDLAQAVHHRGLTQSRLAELLGWKKSRVSNVLHGKANLTIRTLHEISKVLGLEFDISFRDPDVSPCRQPWHEGEDETVQEIFDSLANLRAKTQLECEAMRATARELNASAWRRDCVARDCSESAQDMRYDDSVQCMAA